MGDQNSAENGLKLLDSKENPQLSCKECQAARPKRHADRTWWRRRTLLEKTLFTLLLVFFILTVMTVTVTVTRPRHGSSHSDGPNEPAIEEPCPTLPPQNVCLTTACVKTAARILEAMDSSVDPCEDFFQYACGAWNKKHVIPDDRSNYNTFRKLGDELRVTLKGLLEAEVLPEEVHATKNAKYLYQSCLNTTAIEERGDAPLRDLLRELGGWPVLDPEWEEDDFDITAVIAKLRLLNNRVLVNQWVSSDDKDSTVNIIQLDQAQLGMPSRDYFLKARDDRTLLAYQKFAIDLAKLLGAEPDRAEQEMRDMVDFEVALANITTPEDQRRDTEAMYNKMEARDLSNLTTEIDWVRYIQLVFNNVSVAITGDESVVLYAPEYMRKLGGLLRQTSRSTLANYLVWRLAMIRVPNLPQSYLDVRRDFNKALYGTARDLERWSICVNYVNEHYGMAVGRIFVQDNFDVESKSNALDMIAKIQTAFNNLLEEVPWMDEATRTVAREKATSIQEKIGYPAYIMNDTALNEDYQGSDMILDRYFENVLKNLNAATRRNLQNIKIPVDRTKWSTAPAVVNAFYSSTRNQIMFPAGILQPPFYHASYPKSMNFGGIGMVIGHEITHGFDDKGRQFDKDGNLKQWWSDSVIDKFKEQAQCIIDQYSNFTVPQVNMNLNGLYTQGENIADNGGLKQAFRAYRTWVDEQGEEEPFLPGLSLTHNQIFFLNFAQIWCGTARPESYIQAIRSGRHSPGRFRVIGPLSNSFDFAEAYGCSATSSMNPDHKCSVW